MTSDDLHLDWRFKGFPASADGLTPAAFVAQRPSLFTAGFSWPIVVLRRSALDHNVAVLAAYAAEHGVDLAPHIKTTMSPELWRAQVGAGAWGLTVATPHQARVLRAHGVSRILLANELVDPEMARWAVTEMATDETFELLCYVDSVAGARILGAATADLPGPRLRVLVELGLDGGRAGCRTTEQAVAVAVAVRSQPSLALVGVAGYEGIIGHDRGPATLAAVEAFVGAIRATLETLDRDGLLDDDRGEYLASCGGSTFFDLVAEGLVGRWSTRQPVRTVLRSGAYVSHDNGVYDELSPLTGGPTRRLRPAIELWAEVLSRPEAGLAIVGAGKRDTSFDEGMPVVLATRGRGRSDTIRPVTGFRVDRLNDQHAYVEVPDGDDLPVGDLVCLGISHPCTTHDKWQLVPIVDDDHAVVGTARCYF